MKNTTTTVGGCVGKLLVNHTAIALFSIMISVFTLVNRFTRFFCGLFTILFYLFLIYQMMWTVGGTDRIRVDGGREAYRPWKGLLIGVLYNIPGLVLALLNLLYHFTQIGWMRMGYVIGRFWGCMYIGWWDFFMPKNPAAGFLILLPGIAMTAAAYLIGYHNIYLSSFFGIRPNRKKTR